MHYRTSLFGLGEGLTPGPSSPKIGDDLLPTKVYRPTNFHRPASTHAGDIGYKKLPTNNDRKKERVNDISPFSTMPIGMWG